MYIKYPNITDDFYKALSFAAKAHDGQYDKSGEPYILHPIAVSSLVKSEDEKIVALLHDVIEDTDFTLDDIKSFGFEHLTSTLDCLSRKKDEPYDEFMKRVLTKRSAIKVKIADIKHNLSRIENIPPSERGFADKYKKLGKEYELSGVSGDISPNMGAIKALFETRFRTKVGG